MCSDGQVVGLEYILIISNEKGCLACSSFTWWVVNLNLLNRGSPRIAAAWPRDSASALEYQ